MIQKNEFMRLINEYKDWSDFFNDACDLLKIDILESPLCVYPENLFDFILKSFFDKEGVDGITWWLYEKSEDPELKIWDADGKEVPTETVEDLWNVVKDNRK